MKNNFGTALLLITHNLGIVAESCDRMAVMYAGRIAEEGPRGGGRRDETPDVLVPEAQRERPRKHPHEPRDDGERPDAGALVRVHRPDRRLVEAQAGFADTETLLPHDT